MVPAAAPGAGGRLMERNDPRLLTALPGASLHGLQTPRAPVLSAEIARLDGLVAREAAALLDFWDAPSAFPAALKALA